VSWAALVGTQQQGAQTVVGFAIPAEDTPSPPHSTAAPAVATTPSETAPLPSGTLLPRGIANAGNSCFAGAVLQALLACPPARDLFASLPASAPGRPLAAALRRFMGEFSVAGTAPINLATCVPLRPPAYLYDLLLSKTFMHTAEQHDAQELYSSMLDALHTEHLAASGSSAKPRKGDGDDDDGDGEGWMIVEKGGKRAAKVITQGDEFGDSEVSRVFFGRMRTRLCRQGGSRSVSAQPFSCLHLGIAPTTVRSVNDALQQLFARESIEDTATAANVTSSIVPPLPRVLCLHLKRFAFNAESGVTTKLTKRVGFGRSLVLLGDIAPYRLVAVVRHHGDSAEHGHYTCDVLHGGKRWLTCDDSRLYWTPHGEAGALRPDDAYLLFYCQ